MKNIKSRMIRLGDTEKELPKYVDSVEPCTLNDLSKRTRRNLKILKFFFGVTWEEIACLRVKATTGKDRFSYVAFGTTKIGKPVTFYRKEFPSSMSLGQTFVYYGKGNKCQFTSFNLYPVEIFGTLPESGILTLIWSLNRLNLITPKRKVADEPIFVKPCRFSTGLFDGGEVSLRIFYEDERLFIEFDEPFYYRFKSNLYALNFQEFVKIAHHFMNLFTTNTFLKVASVLSQDSVQLINFALNKAFQKAVTEEISSPLRVNFRSGILIPFKEKMILTSVDLHQVRSRVTEGKLSTKLLAYLLPVEELVAQDPNNIFGRSLRFNLDGSSVFDNISSYSKEELRELLLKEFKDEIFSGGSNLMVED